MFLLEEVFVLNYFSKKKLQSQKFLSSKEYNKIVKKRNSNCLAFAFGRTSQDLEEFDLLTIQQIEKLQNHEKIQEVDICEAFIRKAKEFGYEVKQITKLDGTDGKVVFIVFGWYSQYIKDLGNYDYFFHIIRKNENGSFEHKLDWFTPAKVISFYQLSKWFKLDIERYYFVLN